MVGVLRRTVPPVSVALRASPSVKARLGWWQEAHERPPAPAQHRVVEELSAQGHLGGVREPLPVASVEVGVENANIKECRGFGPQGAQLAGKRRDAEAPLQSQ
jgi:hypothetical protein